jgi:uncharacterized protein (DUF4415 family)
MTNERIIEVEVTAEDLEKMRAEGVSESDLPAIGIKRYRQARHILRDKVVVLLDADIVDHFKKSVNNDDEEVYQSQINRELRRLIEREKS